MAEEFESKRAITLVQRAKWDGDHFAFSVKAVGNPDVGSVNVQRGCTELESFHRVPTDEELLHGEGYITIEEGERAHLERIANNAIAQGVRQVGIGVRLEKREVLKPKFRQKKPEAPKAK